MMIMTMIMVWKLNKIQLKTIIPRCQKSASLDTIMYVSFHFNYSDSEFQSRAPQDGDVFVHFPVLCVVLPMRGPFRSAEA